MDWGMAEGRLYEIKHSYEQIGWEGSFALNMTILPLVKQYESGDRTIELYNDIMDLQ